MTSYHEPTGVRGLAPPRNYLDFYSLKSPSLGFRVIQMGYWPDFNLESVFDFKDIFNMKNVTDFRKTVETGVDPHVQYRIKAPSFDVSKERIHLFLSATGRGECNGPCHARKYYYVLKSHCLGPPEIQNIVGF